MHIAPECPDERRERFPHGDVEVLVTGMKGTKMRNIIYIVGLVVVVIVILSLVGLV